MTLARLMTIIHFGKKPVKPADISEARWNAMVKQAEKMLRIIED